MEDRLKNQPRILLINDMAGYGKVALSVMIPVFSHMKYETFNLPTVLISNTLDYGNFDILDTTEYMQNTLRVWNELQFSFDAICTGFIVSERQLVDYGGNFAVTQFMRGQTRWLKTDQKLLEPTLHNGNDKIFKGWCGTSFSAPHVTHIAARIERALQEQIKEKPSANLIRAILVNSARCTDEMLSWAEASTDVFHKGKNNPKQERRLRLIGFGKANDSLLYSDDNHVTLFAEDSLELRSFHLYKIPVPKEFLKVKAEKSIAISLAYNPITRLSRKDYLTNNLWFEVFRKIDERDLILYKAKKESGEDSEEDLENLPDENKAAFLPGYRDLSKSTLQQRIWRKVSSDDYLHALNFTQKVTLWTGFLKDGFDYKEFEWLYQMISERTVENRIEWELALHAAMKNLKYTIQVSEHEFRLFDVQWKRRYLNFNSQQYAEMALLKILFPVNL